MFIAWISGEKKNEVLFYLHPPLRINATYKWENVYFAFLGCHFCGKNPVWFEWRVFIESIVKCLKFYTANNTKYR